MSRIAIDLRMFRHSGIGRYLRNLIPLLLPRLQAQSVRIVTHPGLIDHEPWLSDPRIERIDVAATIYSIGEQVLPFTHAYRGVDLLWVPHYNVPLGYQGALAVTIHDLAPIALPETLSNPVKRTYARLLIERAASRPAAILTVSAFTASELHQHLGVDASKITVTHPGIDGNWPADAAPYREFDGVPYLLYVGNVKPNKNLTMLLKAFTLVLDRLPHRLVLAGRMRGFGTEDRAVLRQAEALGDRIRWTDEIPDSELIALYAGADALVLPSLYEGFGLPLLEAMQMHCPILCSNAASLPEIAGDAALFFDPRDAQSIAHCLLQVADRARMEDLRRKGRDRLSHFSYATCAERTASVLNELMRRSA